MLLLGKMLAIFKIAHSKPISSVLFLCKRQEDIFLLEGLII